MAMSGTTVAAGPEILDDRDQAHVELAGGQSVGEPAGQVEQLGLRRQLLQLVDERLGVEVVDRADADGSSIALPRVPDSSTAVLYAEFPLFKALKILVR